jgi:flagellar basal body-associated protein FliL
MSNETKNILIGVLLFCLAVAIITIIMLWASPNCPQARHQPGIGL